MKGQDVGTQHGQDGQEHHIEFHWIGCAICGCWVALLSCCCGDSRTWHLPDVVCPAAE